MTAWGNSGYVMADLGLLRNLQLHAAVSFGFRIVIHQTRTVWLSRYFPLRYDGNLSAWLVASINFWIISHTGGLCSPAQVHVSIDTLLCVHLIGKLHIFEWNSDIVDLISYINNFTKSVNMELACSFTTIIRICLCRGSSWLGVNDSAQFALPVCRVIGII
jgi:hypothetical protein